MHVSLLDPYCVYDFFLFFIHVFTNDFIYNIEYYLGLFGREPDFCSDSAIPNSLAVGLTL